MSTHKVRRSVRLSSISHVIKTLSESSTALQAGFAIQVSRFNQNGQWSLGDSLTDTLWILLGWGRSKHITPGFPLLFYLVNMILLWIHSITILKPDFVSATLLLEFTIDKYTTDIFTSTYYFHLQCSRTRHLVCDAIFIKLNLGSF